MRALVNLFLCAVALMRFDLTEAGLRCYVCTLVIDEDAKDPDLTCLTAPQNVSGKPSVICADNKKYCTIIRNDYKDTGKVSSMERSCQEKPDFLDEDIEGPTFVTHYRTCQKDLCNNGDGISHISAGDGGSADNIGAILVKNKDGGAVHLVNLTLLLVTVLLFAARINDRLLT